MHVVVLRLLTFFIFLLCSNSEFNWLVAPKPQMVQVSPTLKNLLNIDVQKE